MSEPRRGRKVKAIRASGFVVGPCASCGMEQRTLVLLEDEGWGVECLACSHMERVVDVEFIEGDGLDN